MRLGKPEKPENYNQTELDGVGVYYKPSLAGLFGKITVKVEKILFVKSLVATGER
ncbi:MAG: hypothetical protein RIN56_06980 [Sporomusaceae bacterium]|nr:hypothetical protein [Sporomusaceae bacterium]